MVGQFLFRALQVPGKPGVVVVEQRDKAAAGGVEPGVPAAGRSRDVGKQQTNPVRIAKHSGQVRLPGAPIVDQEQFQLLIAAQHGGCRHTNVRGIAAGRKDDAELG